MLRGIHNCMSKHLTLLELASLMLASLLFLPSTGCAQSPRSAPPSAGPFTDFRYEKPGATHKITPHDLPHPMRPNPRSMGRVSSIVRKTVAAGARRLQSGAVHDRRAGAAQHHHRSQRRFLRRREPCRRHQDLPRHYGATASRRQSSMFAIGLNQPYGIAFYPPGPTRNTFTSATADAVAALPLSAMAI